MNNVRKNYLFTKHLLVNEGKTEENVFEVLYALADLFGIRITEGAELAAKEMIPYIEERVGTKVPEPFYRGFPESVRALSRDQLLFDQLVHYALTYGFGDFENPGHSLFEKDFERTAFKEGARILDFRIVTEEEAEALILSSVKDLLSSSRPLNTSNLELVVDVLKERSPESFRIASKDTRIFLLVATRDLRFAEGLSLPDVLKVTERLQWEAYRVNDLKKLNLKNQERKFISALIRQKLSENGDFRECYERRRLWNGLLHHVHFEAKTDRESRFLSAMRGKENLSVYSAEEKAMASGNVDVAVGILAEGKGSGAVVRSFNYFLSRGADIGMLKPYLKSCNTILLLQLLMQYAAYPEGKRTFVFSKLNMLRMHTESDEEEKRRRSYVPEDVRNQLLSEIRSELKDRWEGKLQKVYLGEDMRLIAIPIKESTSESGIGVLPKGSRIPLPEGKKLRAFTYWEKVDDIDLSVIGLDAEGKQYEFSWRTMAEEQSSAINFSGDEVSGFKGGSEYFDIDLPLFREEHPHIRRLIFSDNIFSRSVNFSGCFCRAGYMMRDTEDSGEIFEPKTVSSAYTMNCESTYAYLFGLDLENNEFVWLNSAVTGDEQVAGETNVAHLNSLFESTRILSMYDVLSLQAGELVSTPEEADVVATDADVPAKDGALRIRSYDIDVMTRLLETR